MAFWSGAKLKKVGQSKPFVDPFDPKQIDCSAYTLRMGSQAYVTPSNGSEKDNFRLNLDTPENATGYWGTYTRGRATLSIPAGQFGFLLTEEAVRIPKNAMGFISLKSGIKFKGLINVSGFHVDPGFQGNLIYSVYNAGPSPIHLARGDDLFLLWLADLSDAEDEQYTKVGKAKQVEIPTRLISEVDRETYSLQSMSEDFRKLSNDFRVLKAQAAVWGIVLPIAIGIANLIF